MNAELLNLFIGARGRVFLRSSPKRSSRKFAGYAFSEVRARLRMVAPCIQWKG
jgi:hypothetical protein